MILSDGQLLRPQDFPQISGEMPNYSSKADGGFSALLTKTEPTEQDEKVQFLDRDGHLRSLEEIERDLIAFAIENYGGHMSEIARRLGIGRSTLYRKVREHGMDVDNVRSA